MFSRGKKTRLALEALVAEVAALRTELEAQAHAVANERDSARMAAERLTALEARVSGMGSELSRQLHELGDEIETLTNSKDQAAVEATVAALRDAQVRLATEQARYGITFRQDLAALADQLLRRNK